jgi:hypothetical protein
MQGMNLTLIYCKDFCKCLNVVHNNIKKREGEKEKKLLSNLNFGIIFLLDFFFKKSKKFKGFLLACQMLSMINIITPKLPSAESQ